MKNNCCGGTSLPSYNNELEILVRQLQREVNELIKTTEARLLCQSKKIDETMIYIKNNLSNALRDLLDSMLESGEIEEIITSAISNAISLLEIEVEELRQEVHSNDQDIEDLKNNKLEFTEYEDTGIDKKFLNIDVSTEYVNDSIVYITKIKNLDKLSCLPTNGNPTANIETYAKRKECWAAVQKVSYELTDSIREVLISKAEQEVENVQARKEQKFASGISDEVDIFTKGSTYWESLITRGTAQQVINYGEVQMLMNAVHYCNGQYRQLSKHQLKEIARIVGALKENGIE